jgi:nitroreductase
MMRAWLARQLPLALRQYIKASILAVKLFTIRCCASNGFFSSLYYTFFSRKFYREHRAVLLGSLAYHRANKALLHSSALLRRNIHRIEKGLIMRPRREIFAEHYIAETVEHYIHASNSPSFCQAELTWANDVLNEYFSVCGQSSIINPAKAMFIAHMPSLQREALLQNDEAKKVPYTHNNLPQSTIAYDQLLTLFQRRRSVRWYQQREVPMALIEQAVQAAKLAPSACNRQPFQFYVANDSTKACQVASCAMGTVGFADNLPCVITLVGDLACYPEERDRHVIYIDTALAAMQLMLALETLGLSSCPINWPDCEPNERALSEILQLEYWQRPVMLLAVGYADAEGGVPFSEKKANTLLMKVHK